MQQAVYRIWQTLHAITAWARQVDRSLAKEHLSDALYQLFLQMPKNDQLHHLRVLKHVLAQGYQDEDLLVAALLHDVGKTKVKFRIIERVIAVMIEKLLPGYFAKWSMGEAVGWKKAMVVSAQHPAWGAEMLKEAGATPLAIELVRCHQDELVSTMPDKIKTLLPILQKADNAS